jgi:hypothetical protein
VGLWKFICMGWNNFKRHVRFDLGVGSKISFWEDVWCGEVSLKDTFPGLFSIAGLKEASIADNVERSNGVVQWNIVFTRLVHDWEVEILGSFYSRLYSFKFRGHLEDKLWWVPLRKGSFTGFFLQWGSFPFLGKAFGEPRPRLELRFLLGRLLGVRSSPLTIFDGEV